MGKDRQGAEVGRQVVGWAGGNSDGAMWTDSRCS